MRKYKYVCPKCGYTENYSEIGEFEGMLFEALNKGESNMCPKCLGDFLKKHIPDLERLEYK